MKGRLGTRRDLEEVTVGRDEGIDYTIVKVGNSASPGYGPVSDEVFQDPIYGGLLEPQDGSRRSVCHRLLVWRLYQWY